MLVVGLDETLIHTSKERGKGDEVDIILQNQEDGENKEVYVSIRPYAISFLKKMSKKF